MKSITDRRELLTVWRHWLFYVWVIAAMVAAVTAMIAGPLVSATEGADGTKWVALISPAAMMIFVVTGITWLVLLVLSPRSKYMRQPPEGS